MPFTTAGVLASEGPSAFSVLVDEGLNDSQELLLFFAGRLLAAFPEDDVGL